MQSAAGIANGLYYVKTEKDDGDIFRLDLYRIPKVKKANYAVIKGGSAKVNRSTLKKKSVTKKVIKVTKKKGKYKIRVRVTVSGNDDYKPKTKTVTVKIRVK